MKLPRIFLVIGVLSLAALFAFACSDDDEDGNGNGNGNGDPTDVIDELLTDFGVSDTEIKLGQTTALSGNPSATGYAAIASGIDAAFAKINQEDGGACGRLEDTRLAKKLFREDGEEILSAHLSDFSYADPGAAAALLRAALPFAAGQGLSSLFAAVPEKDARWIHSGLEGLTVSTSGAAVYGFGLETGYEWHLNTAEI